MHKKYVHAVTKECTESNIKDKLANAVQRLSSKRSIGMTQPSQTEFKNHHHSFNVSVPRIQNPKITKSLSD